MGGLLKSTVFEEKNYSIKKRGLKCVFLIRTPLIVSRETEQFITLCITPV
jgi:hypothetical protein